MTYCENCAEEWVYVRVGGASFYGELVHDYEQHQSRLVRRARSGRPSADLEADVRRSGDRVYAVRVSPTMVVFSMDVFSTPTFVCPTHEFVTAADSRSGKLTCHGSPGHRVTGCATCDKVVADAFAYIGYDPSPTTSPGPSASASGTTAADAADRGAGTASSSPASTVPAQSTGGTHG